MLLRKLSAETARESAKAKAMEIAARSQEIEEEVAAAIEDAELLEPEVISQELDLVAANLDQGEQVSTIIEGAPADNNIELTDQTFDQIIEDVDVEAQDELQEEIQSENTSYSYSEPVTVDAGFIGDLAKEDFDKMYAEIYGMPLAEDQDLSKAA